MTQMGWGRDLKYARDTSMQRAGVPPKLVSPGMDKSLFTDPIGQTIASGQRALFRYCLAADANAHVPFMRT